MCCCRKSLAVLIRGMWEGVQIERGLAIHMKNMHNESKAKVVLKRNKFHQEFSTEASLKTYLKQREEQQT